jgi:selenocysteine lyase/cysteine desulfurase
MHRGRHGWYGASWRWVTLEGAGRIALVDLADAQKLWDPKPGWLNTASYGLPPRPAWDALQDALEIWRTGAESWERWSDATERSRAAFARLLRVEAADVFVGSTVSSAVALVAASIPDGSTVLVPEVEFTSNIFPWAAHADRGVTVRTAPTDKYAEAIDENVDVVAFSAVQSATGEVADVAAISAAAREAGALVVVDATQAVGWLPVDARSTDACVASTYKWMMSPRGATFGYVAPELRERLRPEQSGWYSSVGHHQYYGMPMRLAGDARRFDQSPAWFSHVGCAPALELIEEIGVEQIHAHNVGLANAFRAGLGLEPGDSAIVSADVPGADERLAAAGVRAAARDGRLRASFHVYSSQADVDLALNALGG